MKPGQTSKVEEQCLYCLLSSQLPRGRQWWT